MLTTSKQTQLLTQLNLPVPREMEAAARLIDFALNGNDNHGHNDKNRRAMIRRYWHDWVGKTVLVVQSGHHFEGMHGRVECLIARNKAEVREIVRMRLAIKPLPFIAMVRIDTAMSSFLLEIHLTGLKLAKGEEVQRRLFCG